MVMHHTQVLAALSPFATREVKVSCAEEPLPAPFWLSYADRLARRAGKPTSRDHSLFHTPKVPTAVIQPGCVSPADNTAE